MEQNTCPICGSELFKLPNIRLVMDGNTVYQCIKDKEHRFWRNAREMEEILHLNKRASQTNFTSEEDFILNDGIWVVFDESQE